MKFDLRELGTYEFFQHNREFLISSKDKNLLLVSCIFSILTIIWVLLLGFGIPVALAGGFIFGKWLGVFLTVTSLTIGATLLYLFGSFFLKDLIREKFLDKFKNLETKFKKNEFIFLLIFRFIGGIPFAIANLLPVLFNVNKRNYFIATYLGITPQHFIMVSLGSGIEEIIKKHNTVPTMFQLLSTPEIYKPIVAFVILVIITLVCRKLFNQK